MPNTSKGFFWLALGAVALLGLGVWWFLGNFGTETLNIVIGILDLLVGVLIGAVTLFFNIFAKLAAVIINSFIILNPFSQISIAPILWEFFKNISYVVLVFLSLWAGFQFILNKEDEARRLLIGILIIAFLINFTYVLAQEFFNFFWHLTKNLLNLIGNVTEYSPPDSNDSDKKYTRSNFGEILLASLSFFSGENAKKIGEEIQNEINKISGIDQNALAQRGVALSFGLFSLSMAFIGTALMFIFAGIAFGKFFIISFLVGVLPLACIAYLLPNQKKYFDQWWHLFLTWNINLPILIILIMIGIFLFASTNSEEIFKIEVFLDPQVSIFKNDIGKISEEIPSLISLSLRFIVISVYYILVIFLALNMGGRFAKAGYDFAKWTWTKTGNFIYGQAKEMASGPLSKLGDRMTNLANKLAQYGGPFALLSKRIRSTAEKLKKPAKERDKEIAEEVWEVAKDESPEEIAKISNKLKGGALEEFARLVNRYKSSDEIFKIFVNSERFQKDSKARKILCSEKLDCALDTIMKENIEDQTKAIQLLAQRLDFNKVNLNDINQLLSQLRINGEELNPEQKKYLLRILTEYLTDRNSRNFFAHPDNLKILKANDLANILQENQETIKQTPTFRIFSESMNSILDKMGITDQNLRNKINNEFLEEYLSGEITQEEIEGWKGEKIKDRINNTLTSIKLKTKGNQTQIGEQIVQYGEEISNKENSIKQINKTIDDKRQEIETKKRLIAEGKISTRDKETVEEAKERLNKEIEDLEQQINKDLETKTREENALNDLQNKKQELENLDQQLAKEIDEIDSIQQTITQLSPEVIGNINEILRSIQNIFKNPTTALPRKRKLTEGPEKEEIEEIVRGMMEQKESS